MKSSWSNENTFKFIDLYQEESIIWNPLHPDHKDRTLINDAWNRISETLGIQVVDLKKKKETLMSAFRMHFGKKQMSIQSGDSGHEVYNPVWIFYDAMRFLEEIYDCASDNNTPEQETSREHKRRTRERQSLRRYDQVRAVEPKATKPSTSELNKGESTHAHTSKENQSTDEDECDLYGRLLACKLRKYSETEREVIMYEIDGLLINRRRTNISTFTSCDE